MLRLLLILFFLICSSSRCFASGENCGIVGPLLQSVVSIRGLPALADVPCFIQSREQVRNYLKEQIAKQLPGAKLANEELIYKKIGLIPEDFDYENGIIEIYAGQLGGYYDPVKNLYVMADWIPESMQAVIAVHELAHALQDQHYDLEKLINPNLDNGDRLLAASALVEGDACAVMIDYERAKNKAPGITADKDIEHHVSRNAAGGGGVFMGKNIPESLRMALLFPYTEGLRFAHALLRKNGYRETDKAFRNPPLTTEEILHPEKYFSGENDYRQIPVSDLLDFPGSARFQPVYQDTIGEFGILALMSMYKIKGVSPKEIAAGWGGDRLALFESGSERIMVWRTEWDSVEDARQFREAYSAVLKEKYGENFRPDIFAGGITGKTATAMMRGGEKAVVILFSLPPEKVS